ncbi:methyltransferase domain-containing protein [Rhodohalobacter sp. 8-1]|uniref:methyltransferase domain-containing protein n=1 Tax=Rhodohalobacter sp. 8-1 TaxID=3131972 RepID=UPI0030EC43AB
MSLFLRERDTSLKEFMDDPNCDPDLLEATYSQFESVNKLLGGWDRIYETYIRQPLIEAGENASVLDIGCGGGDILRLLDTYCRRDSLNVRFTGIEPDSRAITYIKKQDWPDHFSFSQAYSGDLVQQEKSFSIVISNHLMHHLTPKELGQLCDDAENLASRRIIFNDIERSDIGYAGFRAIAPLLYKNSFIVEDGIRSIRRSYQKQELQPVLPDGWTVKRQFPFRLLAICEGGNV